MTMIREGTLDDLTDPALAKLARRVCRELRLAALWAAGHAADPARYPMPAGTARAERLFLTRARRRKPADLARAVGRADAHAALSATARSRGFGELGAVDLHGHAGVSAQARAIALPASARVDRRHLARVAAEPSRYLGAEAFSGRPTRTTTGAGGPALDRLELRIRRVKCIDETGVEWLGNDEIALGGGSIDETGDVREVAAFTVGNNFDDGDQKTYSPPRVFTRFDLNAGGNVWPKTYFVTMVVCEQDGGGFTAFLKDLQQITDDRLHEMIDGEIGPGADESKVKEVLRAISKWIADSIVQWVVDLWNDDLFPAKTATVSIDGLEHLFGSGSHTSQEYAFTTSAHGGKYKVWYDWRVVAHT